MKTLTFSILATTHVLLLLISTATKPYNSKPDPNWWKHGDLITRSQFFKDLTNMDENTFVSKARWTINNPFNRYAVHGDWVLGYKDKYGDYRRAACYQGTFSLLSLRDLNKAIGNIKPLTNKAQFSIIVLDPWVPWYTDIRYLQSIPSSKQSAFQLASTFFGPLEGGMARESSRLSDMVAHAVQGEEASINAAGATFYRKYVMGTPKYLLYYLKSLPMHGTFYSHYGIDDYSVTHYTYKTNDELNVEVGIHKDVAISTGYGASGDKGKGQQQRLRIYTYSNGTVDTTKSQIVTQILTSALNLHSLSTDDPHVINAAQMLLRASYESTIKAAICAGSAELYLTLMGGGAFLNEIGWIGNALNRPACTDTIKKYKSHVHLVYRPDKLRDHPIRDANTDLAFFETLLFAFDTINGTHYHDDPVKHKEITAILTSYLTLAYQYEYEKAHPPVHQITEDSLHSAAVEVNALFN